MRKLRATIAAAGVLAAIFAPGGASAEDVPICPPGWRHIVAFEIDQCVRPGTVTAEWPQKAWDEHNAPRPGQRHTVLLISGRYDYNEGRIVRTIAGRLNGVWRTTGGGHHYLHVDEPPIRYTADQGDQSDGTIWCGHWDIGQGPRPAACAQR